MVDADVLRLESPSLSGRLRREEDSGSSGGTPCPPVLPSALGVPAAWVDCAFGREKSRSSPPSPRRLALVPVYFESLVSSFLDQGAGKDPGSVRLVPETS